MSQIPVSKAEGLKSRISEYTKPVIAFESVLSGESQEGMIQLRVETYFRQFPLSALLKAIKKREF